ncbi:MAG: A/G-specific adenine glycosylase [Planctomycetaceae bacterium]|nr:A/G-specific adenine glycosylase [Planctomycetaceae bacterium]
MARLAWNGQQRRKFLKALQAWSQTHGRQLPWRSCGNPYWVWLSEIMLQQTTVAAVIPYFERFLTRFPTLSELASAEVDDVLRLWEGLGYYSRARNLYAAARRIVTEFGGEFPREIEQLRQLPGIGRYTAGAIASFAFDAAAPIVEANTQRLYARLLGEDREIKGTAAQSALWEFADFLVSAPATGRSPPPQDRFGPGAINQALMDLGATVCTPTLPSCTACPVAQWCSALANNCQHTIPRLATRPSITHMEDATVAIVRSGRFLLRRRPTGERWAGLWDFPRYTIPVGESLATVVTQGVWQQTGLRIELGQQVAEFKHSVTRYRITLRCLHGTVTAGDLLADADACWVRSEELEAYALSVTGRKFARWLQQQS